MKMGQRFYQFNEEIRDVLNNNNNKRHLCIRDVEMNVKWRQTWTLPQWGEGRSLLDLQWIEFAHP